MNHHQKIQLDILEDDIDHNGLSDLLKTIAEICHDKSRNITNETEKWEDVYYLIRGMIPTIKELVG